MARYNHTAQPLLTDVEKIVTVTDSNLPDFIIIGAMKSATSTLHDQLVVQPGFKMSDPKEPNFFSDDDVYAKGIDWYKSLFVDEEAIIRGESSTHYTKLPTYPETLDRMIEAGLSKAKLIYVVRDPVERLISHYIHEWSEANISCDINEAISRHPELIAYSRYFYQLSAFLQHFKPEQICIVFFECLIRNSQEELERICHFLEYPHKPVFDTSLGAKNVSSQRIRKFPLQNLIINSKVGTSLRRKFIPKSFRNRIKENLKIKKRPELNKENTQKLVDIFDQDLKMFGSLIGVEISTTSFKQVAADTVACNLQN